MAAADFATTVYDYVITVTDADTEYSQALPENIVALEIMCRDGTAIRHSFTTGGVAAGAAAGDYKTLLANGTYYKDHLYLNEPTLYVACDSSTKYVEVRCWTV